MMIEEQVQLLVREIMGRAEEIAMNAVRDAFATRQGCKATKLSAQRGPAVGRRSGTEIAQLGDRLYAEICAEPGALMTVLAERVGVPAKELNLPARRLNAGGKIKTTGSRGATRYFPTGRVKN